MCIFSRYGQIYVRMPEVFQCSVNLSPCQPLKSVIFGHSCCQVHNFIEASVLFLATLGVLTGLLPLMHHHKQGNFGQSPEQAGNKLEYTVANGLIS